MDASSLQRAQQDRQQRADELLDERVEYVLDYVGLSEESCLQLANFERVGPEARHKLRGILRKYARSDHPFTDCVRDNRKRFGSRAEKVCAVIKDLIEGTTKWRKGPKRMNAADVVLDCPILDEDVVALLEHVDTSALSELLAEED